jgi:hypothetical protein
MMKINNQRGYINQKYRAVMLWHRSLQCWILSRIQKNGKIQSSLYAFKNSRSEAISFIRLTYGIKVPQSGWSGIQVQHKELRSWDELVMLSWNQNQNQIG